MLATLQQLKTRLGKAADETVNDTELTELLTAAGKEFEVYCQRELELANRVDYFTGLGTRLKLKSWPVVSVSEIKIAADYDFDGADALIANTDYRLVELGKSGIVYRIGGSWWPQTPDSIKISYRAGFVPAGTTPGTGETAVPAELAQAAIDYAALAWKRRDTRATKSENFEGGSTTFERVELDAKTKAILDKYKLWTL